MSAAIKFFIAALAAGSLLVSTGAAIYVLVMAPAEVQSALAHNHDGFSNAPRPAVPPN